MATRTGTSGGNTLVGTAGSDTILGLGGNDTLRGLGGNDSLDGGTGRDRHEGGAGDDRYIVNRTDDIVIEGAGAGTDTVLSSATFTLPANVERLTLTGAAAINGTGNSLANVMTGNGVRNTLVGAGGNDTLIGGGGNDRLDGGTGVDTASYAGAGAVKVSLAIAGAQNTVGSGTDTLVGIENLIGGGNGDTLTGNSGNNRLSGAAGNDLLIGGAGNDNLVGGAGSDTVSYAGGAAVRVSLATVVAQNTGGAGTDTLASIENLIGSGFADTLTGSSGANRLAGGAGGDTLNGRAGGDTLEGGSGDDTLDGGAGDDTLDGGSGVDSMIGGTGDDRYVIDSDSDTPIENPGEGIDTVVSDQIIDISAYSHVENATLTGSGDVDIVGTDGDNVLVGNEGANTIIGDDGNDTLDGAAGSDGLDGGNGEDRILGGSGGDMLGGAGGDDRIAGGTGSDTAVFTGNQADYTVTTRGLLTIVTDNEGSDGDEGTDVLVGVQMLQFADNQVAITDGVDGVLKLSSLDGISGFRVDGVAAFDNAGYGAVSNAGDVNGDGFTDFLIGALFGNSDTGSAYVVFGKADFSGSLGDFDLASLDGTNGFVVDGIGGFDATGGRVAAAGDINGDGFADVIIGASGANSNGVGAGSAFVVLGRADFTGTLGDIDLSGLDGTDGFRLNGAATNDRAGSDVGGAGDFNGDGLTDLIVGASTAMAYGYGSGAAYVVFGRADGFAAASDLGDLDGTTGFRIAGVSANDRAGTSVANAGDVNGDGFDDVIIGASRADPSGTLTGAAYLVFGAASGFTATLDLANLDGTNGFRIDGVAFEDFAGISVDTAGDVNGDGFGDIIVGANGADANGGYSGSSFVIFGKAGGFAVSISLGSLDGSNGFRLDGVAAFDLAGTSVGAAGDVNGDGYDDIIVGAKSADPEGGYSGSSYVIFGKADGFTATFALSGLDGSNGYRLDGVATNDFSGSAVSAAGDINGDGLDDVIIGSKADGNGNNFAGSSYVVFGTDVTFAITHRGTTGDDTLAGDAGANVLVGDLGDDTLIGGAGNDVLVGAAGDDILVFDAADGLRVDGGLGADTLRLGGSGATLNLVAVNDTEHYTLYTGIEIIDLTGTGNNTLVLGTDDLLRLSDTTNTLRVDGGAGDVITTTDIGWGDGTADANIAGYTTYTNGNATLIVDSDITRSGIGA